MTTLQSQHGADAKELTDLRGERIWDDLAFFLGGSTYKKDHAQVLRFFNQALAITQAPTPQQLEEFAKLEKTMVGKLSRMIWDGVQPARMALLDLQSRTLLNCAVAGLAAERYRLQHHAWPKSLDELVAARLLEAVPLDLFDGKPLRYRLTDKAAVVYSVGPEGQYQGDALDDVQAYSAATLRFEFRLWFPEQRGAGMRPHQQFEDHPGEKLP